jgi:hypothetical protein
MYNDFDKILKSFEIGGENKPPKRGPWSKKNVNKRRAKRAMRKAKRNCGKPGCSRGIV